MAENVGSPELPQFKRSQNERGLRRHDIWTTIEFPAEVSDVRDNNELALRDLRSLREEGSESKLKSRVMDLEHELQRLYGAYGELKGLHEKLWKSFVDEKME
jgi:hypothetical protein